MKHKSLIVGAYQAQAVYNNIPLTIQHIQKLLKQAESEHIDILCLPECYLNGYILNESAAHKVSIDLSGSKFKEVLSKFYSDSVTLIVGLIERSGESIFNTAVVIEQGKVIGKYRKQNIHNKEQIFKPGTESPVFEKKGIKFGINICYDARFVESAKALSNAGAKLIFYPLNNSLPHEVANKWKDKHIENLVENAKQTNCWIVSADVIEETQEMLGYGCTAIIDPQGTIISYLPHLKPGLHKALISF